MEIIPDDCLGAILAFWAADYAPATREVCRRWRDLAPARGQSEVATLRVLAAAGREDLLEWVLVQRRGQQPVPVSLSNLTLGYAARSGHVSLCRRAKEWGATNVELMLCCAAMGGHDELCHIAKGWGATEYDKMIRFAAQGGYRDLCYAAKDWGADDFDEMLYRAARGGHKDLCRLAITWGARQIEWMMYAASGEEYVLMRDLVDRWTADAAVGEEYVLMRDLVDRWTADAAVEAAERARALDG